MGLIPHKMAVKGRDAEGEGGVGKHGVILGKGRSIQYRPVHGAPRGRRRKARQGKSC